ncbi:MAG: cysteine--tRNA ligase [Bacteroidota bacterium]|jgi:cysteinyl-tRNA synthetase|nr:cysteine--tRNA ligase [Ignavibacteria bacterium]MCU7498204.1 cysteine--tRNA ligase [Ignavibacteria bacterium]MCU7511434.1 cysteine--tRNA ligase [Ignavibacteria bacterium]MCU7519407.1 cysteine--tRNA ligase [Ignavibacteria bacterium]MCU7523351.1 cysteine--tRNA ligase [Ignavibacteria bacterium]
MQIYNTLTRKKEEFIPQNPPEVTMYVCGPTVYDLFHIGNARSFIMADIIRRYLEYKGYKVKYAMNLTDIDDKIIRKSNQENTDAKHVAEKYISAFFEDTGKLNIKKADIYPKATEHIQDIIAMIKELEDSGFAYNVDGNVFYDVSKFPGYGKLSGKKIDELEAGARIEINEEKKNPLDFSLWKKAKEGEPFWESPWGKGRPGWHIECSAMSTKHLGETIDIHAGGSDLIFPHHENEIAQSEAAHKGHQFVNYWMHFGFLNIQNEKMSKSLGNFFTARDVLARYSPETIRLFFAQTHYSGPLNFSEELLQAAQKGLEKILNLVEKTDEEIKSDNKGEMPELDIEKFKKDFEAAMDDDFNTPQATAVIFDFVREANRAAQQTENVDSRYYRNVREFLTQTAQNVLGIISSGAGAKDEGPSLENELVELLIRLRLKARQEKNFGLSDEIRDELKKLGIVLQDQKDKTTFKKVKEQ